MKTSLQTKIGTHVYLHKCVGRYIVIKSDKTMQYTIFQHIFFNEWGKTHQQNSPYCSPKLMIISESEKDWKTAVREGQEKESPP